VFCCQDSRNEARTLQNPGGFVISLDFELYWGVRDHRTVDQYRNKLLGVRQAIPRILDLFERHKIHATWATVGFLFFKCLDDLKAALPDELPFYRDTNLNPYAALPERGNSEDEDPYHFAPDLIRKILATEGQEVGTHTFSHFYPLAPGPTLESFRADIRSAQSVARQFDIKLKSIVFPRNQISRQHIRICAEEGLIAYRSTEADPWIENGNDIVGRAMRLADSYLRLSGCNCVTPCLDAEAPIVKVSQSRFLRPWSAALSKFENVRMGRICASMDVAAKYDKTFHLWWHPHNFGVHLEENMAALTHIVEHFEKINREMDWPSLNMAEVAANILRVEKSHWVA